MDPVMVNLIRKQGCETDQCIRIVNANFVSVSFFYPQQHIVLDQRSTEIVKYTHTGYASEKAQCRMDTVLAGALCSADPRVRMSSRNQRDGSCTQGTGARPACWFMPYNLDLDY
jgi:hypothetical protein